MHNSSFFASLPGVLILLALVIACAYFGATLAAAFLLLVLLLSGGACLWSGSVLNKAEISLPGAQTACHAGDTLNLTLRLRSRSYFPLIWLDVFVPLGEKAILQRDGDNPNRRFTLPYARPQAGFEERFAWLLWQQEISCEETLRAVRRGVADIRRVSLQAGDGLGLSAEQCWKALSQPVRLSVYPRLMQVDVRPLTRRLTDAEAGPRGQTEDITLLKSSRPYQHGDPMKRINWRYLAMSGRMEVNQYELITPGCITFLVDLFSFRYEVAVENESSTKAGGSMRRVLVREDALERMLSLVASCLQALFEQGLRFALVIPAYGDRESEICPPGSGETALYHAMDALAAIDYRGEEMRLPLDELRRMRRKLGMVQLCALTDAPTLLESLEAIGLSRLHGVACMRGDNAEQTGDLDCLLVQDLLLNDAGEGGAA